MSAAHAADLRCTVTSPSRRIAGWLPAGMLDWPGKIAMTVFLSGCDFACPFCHNPDLLQATETDDQWTEVREYVRRRRSWIDGVVMSGGEPLRDPDVVTLLEAFAAEGVPVKLDTNGTDPMLLGSLIEDRLVSAVAVDVKTTFNRYDLVTRTPGAARRVADTVDVVLASGIPHEFRTTVFPGVVDPVELPIIASALAGGDLYALQQFRPQRTLDPQAASVTPIHPDTLRTYAEECSVHLPTVTRGV
ncbi:MAG: anaerobic ribonucleoside-triphosphate reductase activating protein [Coriobacteriia bacterium]|nr:anaerobic ribonucleoside-triphosphate reductase activating protein [Coriobacteriia bacterium]